MIPTFSITFCFETELTNKSEKILGLNEPLSITFTIWNEVVYVISRKVAEVKFGVRSYRKFRELVASKSYDFCTKELEVVESVINDLDIKILADYQNFSEVRKIMERVRLLPNDALIAATCIME